MRCYSSFFLFISLACLVTLMIFVSYSQWISMPSFRVELSSKSWTLKHRNHRRWIRVTEQFRPLVNLSAFQPDLSIDKTLIYSCQSFCGGWGDRLRGILSAYFLALLSGRRFLIDMSYPCDLLRVVQPNFVNWTFVPSPNRKRLTINTMRSWQTQHRRKISTLFRSKDFVQIWSSYDEIFISTNEDYTSLAFRNPFLSNRTSIFFSHLPISQATMQNLFPLIFELLFKPSPSVTEHVDRILHAARDRHLICFHIRVGKNPTNPFDVAFPARANTTRVMIDFTQTQIKRNHSSLIFVTSDSAQAVSDVLRTFPQSSMTIVGPIVHIDRFDRKSSTICNGFIKVLADFYLLGECETSLLSDSGFSIWANGRRTKTNENLFFFDEKLNQMRKA